MAQMPSSSSFLRIGLLGLGNVGRGVVEILTRHAALIFERTGVQFQLVRACVQDLQKPRALAQSLSLTTDPLAVVTAKDIDIVVELIGGLEPAYSWLRQALQAGKSVVTANKAVLARYGLELAAEAATHQVDIYFEGAVAGGIPIIRTLREGLAGDKITALRGILNGTTNFMLNLLAQGHDYAWALKEAQRLGYAEADPTLDVSGRDAADKLAILTRLAFGVPLVAEDIPTQGIVELIPEVLQDAERLGYQIKLLASAVRVETAARAEQLEVRVAPVLLPQQHVLSKVPESQNALAIVSDALGQTLYQGPGAGGLPTGSAVVADLIEAARNQRVGSQGRLRSREGSTRMPLLPPAAARSAFYLRLGVDDRPGVLAKVATILASYEISLATVWQREAAVFSKGTTDRAMSLVPLVLTTHPTSYGAMEQAVQALRQLSEVHGYVSVLALAGDDVVR